MLDSKNYSALEILHQNESFIYEEFATESIDNIHVNSIDLKRPLSSILRVALSDIISSQILASKKDSNSESSKFNLRIYPDALYIVDKNSKKFSSIVLNKKNCDVREYLLQDYQNPEVIANEFREHLFNSDLLTKCAKNYKFKDRNYLVKKSEVEEELGNILLEKKCFSNHYSNTKFEVTVKSKNRISYKVYVFYDVFKKDNDQFELDETIKDDFINHFLKKIFVLAISTKRNKEFYRRIKSTSLKSSLAAVMSRNMSHNIGSHVLNKLSSASEIQKFFDLKEERRFVEGILRSDCKTKFPFPNLSISSEELNRSLEPGDSKKETPLEKFNKKLKENPSHLEKYKFSTFIGEKEIYTLSPYFVDLNNNTTKEELARVFNDYLKKRMDFVADVATSNKALLNSNKYLFADIFRGFERNLLLLQNISGKEDKFSYQFQFQYYDGDETSNYYHYDDDNNLVLENGVPKKNNDFIDPIVAVPNDVLGSQAFYIILENIIRNTAKHSGSGNVIFTIKVEDLKEDDFYRVTVFDNVSFNADKTDIEKYKDKIKDFKALKKKEQDNAIKAYKLKKLVVDRNISIAQEVLDENNEIRTAGWGTIEIKLAACYLSGLDLLEMDNKLYWPIGYPAFAKEKLKEAKTEETTYNEEKIKENAKEAYIEYLTQGKKLQEENKKFEIPVEGSKGFVTAIDCPDSLKRTILKKGKNDQTDGKGNGQGNGFTRYPIVQAVDGSADETSGFGYSFLMKKPKKLLIIDGKEHLKLETKDNEGNVLIKHEDNVNALKRLGIDIIKDPKRDSIYNHQFMIIVGDENSRQYGDWFNLPQERFVFNAENLNYHSLDYYLKKNSYEKSKNGVEYRFRLADILTWIAEDLINKKYPTELSRLYNCIRLLRRKKHLSIQSVCLFPDLKTEFKNNEDANNLLTFKFDRENNDRNANFGHHGIPADQFKINEYCEIYGSVSPIGLHLESIASELSKDNSRQNVLQEENQLFYDDAVNNYVMVIDERIQSVLNDVGYSVEAKQDEVIDAIEIKGYPAYTINYNLLFKKSKVLVPEVENDFWINGNQLKFEEPIDSINDAKNEYWKKIQLKISLNDSSLKGYKDAINKYIEIFTEFYKPSHFVIHFGILESLRDGNEVVDVLNEIKASIKNSNCKIVIASGRGHTPDIKSLNQYFVSYSTLSHLLIDPNGRSKAHLMKCLKQLRIQKNN